MAKKLIKSITVGLFVFLLFLIVFFTTFYVTYKKSLVATSDALNISEKTSAREPESYVESVVIAPDSYLARYDGKDIVIYAVTGSKEEFLYSLRLRIADISEKDLEELRKGISLPDRQALASFEEDFTS